MADSFGVLEGGPQVRNADESLLNREEPTRMLGSVQPGRRIDERARQAGSWWRGGRMAVGRGEPVRFMHDQAGQRRHPYAMGDET